MSVNFISANVNMTVKNLVSKMEEGKVTFENAVQRGLVWDDEKKSYLIDSILQGYPIPAFYAKKGEGNVFDMLDGKQRSNAIKSFVNNEFNLTNMSDSLACLDGVSFEDLSEEDKNTILETNLNIIYFDGVSEEEVSEIFYRLNNGKPLTNFERVKARCRSRKTAMEILENSELLKIKKNGKEPKVDKQLEIVFKSAMTMFESEPSYESKRMNPFMIEHLITEEEKEHLEMLYSRVYKAYNWLMDNTTADNKKVYDKVRARIIAPTHLLSILPFANLSIIDEMSIEDFAKWLASFFNGTRSATNDNIYNEFARTNSAKVASVKKRFERLEASYNRYKNENDIETLAIPF